MEIDAQGSLEIVRRAVVRTRNAQLIVAAAMLLFAALFATGFDPHAVAGRQAVALAPAAFFGLVGALMIWVALVKSDPDRSPLLLALRDRPELVVWIYARDVHVHVHGADAPTRDRNVIAHLADGTTAALTVKKDRSDELLAAIAKLAPDAANGYSEERLAQFKREPRSLLRS